MVVMNSVYIIVIHVKPILMQQMFCYSMETHVINVVEKNTVHDKYKDNHILHR